MCDTAVVVSAEGVLFGKNSDREPLEAQGVEVLPPRPATPRQVCTELTLPGAAARAVLLSRPVWMWGAEMGANDAGVVIGNEAVYARLPVEKTGLCGMDLLRLALERAGSAEEAAEVIIGLLASYPQGGRMGFILPNFRYHSSFLVADARQAFVLETAGKYWALERVQGVRTISNGLTIGRPDRAHPEAADFARRQGWLPRGAEFDFARAFARPGYRSLSGSELRRACTAQALSPELAPSLEGAKAMMAALRSHAGRPVWEGLIMKMPCAHASWSPARATGQTTASMVSALSGGGARHWLTGTSSPCLSVFKPAAVEGESPAGLPPERADQASLFWRHERLHRAVLQGYQARRATFEAERAALEAQLLEAASPRDAWERHGAALPAWEERARAAAASGPWAFRAWWKARAAA